MKAKHRIAAIETTLDAQQRTRRRPAGICFHFPQADHVTARGLAGTLAEIEDNFCATLEAACSEIWTIIDDTLPGWDAADLDIGWGEL